MSVTNGKILNDLFIVFIRSRQECKRALSNSVTFGNHPDQAVGQYVSRELESEDSWETPENLSSSHDGSRQRCLSVHNGISSHAEPKAVHSL